MKESTYWMVANDIKNPNADRRCTNDWSKLAVIPAGMILELTESTEWGGAFRRKVGPNKYGSVGRGDPFYKVLKECCIEFELDAVQFIEHEVCNYADGVLIELVNNDALDLKTLRSAYYAAYDRDDDG